MRRAARRDGHQPQRQREPCNPETLRTGKSGCQGVKQMKFGVNTFIWTGSFDRSHIPLLAQIKEHGFDGAELPLFDPAQFQAADLRRGLEENGLECTICSCLTGGTNMISDDAAVRARTLTPLQDIVKKAAEAGA